MTEAEWLACGEPEQVLKLLDWRTRNRKMRLFACACCRQIWEILTQTECRTAIEVVERALEGTASEREVQQAVEAAMQIADDAFDGSRAPDASAYATSAVADAVSPFSGPSKIAVSRAVSGKM
jgi:hypothetical protein